MKKRKWQRPEVTFIYSEPAQAGTGNCKVGNFGTGAENWNNSCYRERKMPGGGCAVCYCHGVSTCSY